MSATFLTPLAGGTRHAVKVFVPSKISSISSRVRAFVSGYMKNWIARCKVSGVRVRDGKEGDGRSGGRSRC